MQEGRGLALLAARIRATQQRAAEVPALAAHAQALAAALERLLAATRSAWADASPDEALANATPCLQAFGHVVIAWVWLDVAVSVQASLSTGNGDADALRGKLAACRFFFHHELPRVPAWLAVVESRDDTCRTMQESWF